MANILEENGMELFEKHFSLVTPRDFYELKDTRVVYEGTLHEFNERCRRYPKNQANRFWRAMRKITYGMNGAV